MGVHGPADDVRTDERWLIMAEQGTTDRYLVLIREPEGDPATATDEEWAAMSAAHKAFSDAVIAAGAKVVGGEGLLPTKYAVSIAPATDGKAAVFTDGPFTETREVVSGFYLLQADSSETARELAALCPTGGHIELYPVLDTGNM
jgi:Uncharacterized protein conserved in bacteria